MNENPYDFTGEELGAFGKRLAAEREALLRAAQALLADLCATRFQAQPEPYIASQTRFDARTAYLLIGCPFHGQTVILEMVVERADALPARLPAVLRTPLHGEVGMRILDVPVTPELWKAATELMDRATLEAQVRQERDDKAQLLWAALHSAARAAWNRGHAHKLSMQFSGAEQGPDELTYRFRFETEADDPLTGAGAITCGPGAAGHSGQFEVRIDLATDAGDGVFSEVWKHGSTDRIGQMFRDIVMLERRREAIRLGADPAYAATSMHEAPWMAPQG
ncbi:hypothetical protein [Roseomonas xinghualingensis]|uniref:hypothetical protein n=1 Tax=Roseomonas xinghualingensis TaxID=2986475 RepID=UPI0021F1F540|nr:hypothetical protein [Roseomonas sp. SXEYE001]MCV4209618.1 hypothetical protein [Roseomonas sp. SXEYE001]